MDTIQNVGATVRDNQRRLIASARGSARSAGLGSGQGLFGFGILGGSSPMAGAMGAVQNVRQKVGNAISGKGGMALAANRVFVEGRNISSGAAAVENNPILP
jgi:hypothetical protein